MLKLVPLNLKDANELVTRLHRHNGPLRGGSYFNIGLFNTDKSVLVGAVTVGSIAARGLTVPWGCEVRRLVTDGTKNSCSILYGAAWRAAKALGYEGMLTYTLTVEPGISLRASGWRMDDDVVPVRIWVSRNPKYNNLPWSKRPQTGNSPALPRYRWFIGRRVPSKSLIRYADDPPEMGADMPERWAHPPEGANACGLSSTAERGPSKAETGVRLTLVRTPSEVQPT